MQQISEYSEAGITVRGIHIPAGKQPPKPPPGEEEERRLYLAIEATSEIALKKAKADIVRLIRDELARLVSTIRVWNAFLVHCSKYLKFQRIFGEMFSE